MRETVDLDGLAIKIYGKYLKFLQQKVHEIIDRPPQPLGAAGTGAGAGNSSTKDVGDNMNLNVNENTVNDTMNFNDLQVESSKLQKAAGLVVNAQRLAKMNDPPQVDLNTSVATVSSRYRHENLNSIYYLKPNSMDIFLLDFKQQGFCKESLKWNRNSTKLLPREFTSQ